MKIDSLCLTVEILQQHGSFLLVNQTFPHKVKPDECLWSLVGEHVQVCTFHWNDGNFRGFYSYSCIDFPKVNLEKKDEQWWDRLFSSDPPIDTKKIDTAEMASELSQEEHMKIEELMVNQEKRQQFPSVIWKLFSDFVKNENVIEKQRCCVIQCLSHFS